MGKTTRRKRRPQTKNGYNQCLENGTKHCNNEETAENSFSSAPEWASNIGTGFIQFGLSWLVIATLVHFLSARSVSSSNTKLSDIQVSDVSLNTNTSSRGDAVKSNSCRNNAYTIPDLFNISTAERMGFHHVVKFPQVGSSECPEEYRCKRNIWRNYKVPRYNVIDFTQGGDGVVIKEVPHKPKKSLKQKEVQPYRIGRYNEHRSAMYESDLFQDTSNAIDGYAGARTVHMGIDIYAPVGTKVFSFSEGVVHSAGYSSNLGDYGHVVVIQYHLGNPPTKIWALYGHLDKSSIKGKSPGRKINRGEVIGRMGNVHENGGWQNAHLHFQLSIKKPETHDMPGVVSLVDREKAIVDYPDPRIILGKLY